MKQVKELINKLLKGEPILKPAYYCDNGIYRIEVETPKPKYKGDKYTFGRISQYDKHTRRFEWVMSYGRINRTELGYALRTDFFTL